MKERLKNLLSFVMEQTNLAQNIAHFYLFNLVNLFVLLF